MKRTKSRIASDSGKTNPTLRWLAETHAHEAPVVYVTEREEVEKLDVSRFIAAFGPVQSQTKLREMFGRTFHTIHGYEDTDVPLYEIPEVRKFYAHLSKVWPCWTFTASLKGPCFLSLALCVAPNLSIRRTNKTCSIHVPERDLNAFVASSLNATAVLHLCSGLSARSGDRRIKAVAAYFGIRYH